MQYDAVIIGAGLSGLTAASLLAKRGLKVAVVEHGAEPGGSCGIFKRKDAVFDQGAAMLYGFGEHGFNAHRFLFNCLEEPFEVVKHELLYIVHFGEKKIRFWPDIERFIEELSQAFPGQGKNIRRFYKDMQKCYSHVMSESPSYTTPDETNPKEALRNVLRHPISYFRFLSYLNISAEKLLRKYFSDSDILHFFDKLTSTYCYATLKEAPAILASVMFIDNHEGGSFYPAGSTMFLPGKLEKVIEENNGDMYYESTVVKILFEDMPKISEKACDVLSKEITTEKQNPCGVLLNNGTKLYGKNIIYSGTVWNLYGKLLSDQALTDREKAWAAQIPTYPSVVLYALADSSVIPKDTCPIEMLAANPDAIDESEITVYIFSMDDHTICPKGQHAVIAIGPSFRDWDTKNPKNYEAQKQEEIKRITAVLENRFPGFLKGMLHCELATPKTIERYTLKNGGSAAGPKQMLGQHMLLRQPVRTRWDSLFVCGDSTTMGTGTPTVTTSGIAAANAVLKKAGLDSYVWKPNMKNYVHILRPPVEKGWMNLFYPAQDAEIMSSAGKCRYCSSPSCCSKKILDIPGIMRRTACGNFVGAGKLIRQSDNMANETGLCDMTSELQNRNTILNNHFLLKCEESCVQKTASNGPVLIRKIMHFLKQKTENV